MVTASPDTAVAINQKWMARMAAAKMALQVKTQSVGRPSALMQNT